MTDKNVSPVDWYACSYLIRFTELNDSQINNEEKKFISWENTILVKASSLEEAYNKAIDFAKPKTAPYKGGPNGIDVQWVFEGITEVLPIYEDLEDGAEIMWLERNPKKLKKLKQLVHTVDELYR
jgi:hypothetical protein